MTDDQITMDDLHRRADALADSMERVLLERNVAQSDARVAQAKLQIAVIALRQIAWLESDVVSSIRDLARATLLDLGEMW